MQSVYKKILEHVRLIPDGLIRIQSDRFENPAIMVCPVWNQVDLSGRPVNADSFMTKTAGCNNPGDRVVVENYLRPDYSEYVNLNPMGYRAPLYNSKQYGSFKRMIDAQLLNNLLCNMLVVNLVDKEVVVPTSCYMSNQCVSSRNGSRSS